jgi:hypothetical protein
MGVRHQLLRAGIPEEDIPANWMPAIIAAMEKWLITTEDGLSYISTLFDFKIKPADSDKDYTLIDNVNNTSITLKNSQVWFFEGCLVNGHPVPVIDPNKNNPIQPIELEIENSTKNQCESCGIVVHCLREILEPITDSLISLCNYCISFHEHPKVSDLGGWTVCEECTVVRCKNHPKYAADSSGRTHVASYSNVAR